MNNSSTNEEKKTENQENQEKQAGQTKRSFSAFYDPTPEQIHCRRCKTLMENGVCPTCGFRMYVPMDEKKKGKIKFVLTCGFMAILFAVVVIMQIAKS